MFFVSSHERDSYKLTLERVMGRLRLFDSEKVAEMKNQVPRLEWRAVACKSSRYDKKHPWRLLDSVIGFHTGNLDRRGRHLPRYKTLIRRWKAFLYDFDELSLTIELRKSESGEEAEYVLTSPEVWNNFVTKWHISQDAGYGELVQPVLDVLDQLYDTPSPKIQAICLHDLPTEILDYLYQYINSDPEDVHNLSSTCRRLWDIGKRYVFAFRSLHFTFRIGFHDEVYDKSERETTDLILSLIGPRKEMLLDDAKSLTSDQDLTDAARSLEIRNSVKWLIERDARAVNHDDVLGLEFYRPIYDAFRDAIFSCRNLQTLEIAYIELSVDILQAISTLPCLNVLEYDHCTIPAHVQACIYAGGIINPNPSVLNLEIQDGYNIPDPWVLVLLYPKLRTLYVGNMLDNEVLQPPWHFLEKRGQLFNSLERMCIDGICPEGVLVLANWIRLDASKAPLQLTHLHITSQRGIPDANLFELLDALQTVPLKVLSVNGIRDGSLELFDRMAATFPQLLGLSLMRRENEHQLDFKSATWPHATSVYGPHFSGFQSLEHFSWNFRLPRNDEYTPACMKFLEEGFPTEEDSGGEEDCLSDRHYLVYPFAGYCATMKTLEIKDPRFCSDNTCLIKRDGNQQVKLENFKRSTSFVTLSQWSPSEDGHWPFIYPRLNY